MTKIANVFCILLIAAVAFSVGWNVANSSILGASTVLRPLAAHSSFSRPETPVNGLNYQVMVTTENNDARDIIFDSVNASVFSVFHRRYFQDTTPHSNNASIDFSEIKSITPYGSTKPPLYFAQWNHKAELDKHWGPEKEMFRTFQKLACPGSVAVDIGAHGGDTTLPLAAAVGVDGLVLAFEPGPPYPILRANTWINAAYRIHSYNFAIDQVDDVWCYYSNCNGCNGGKVPCGSHPGREIRLVSHRLQHVLHANYDPEVADRISFVKVDTEGHDAEIVRSLGFLNRSRPVMQVEWYGPYRKTLCSKGTKDLFVAAQEIDYRVYVLSDDAVYVLKNSCQDLQVNSAMDLYLFPSERPPLNSSSTGERHRLC